VVEASWFKDTYIPTFNSAVRPSSRHAHVLCASAAAAALDHIHDWMLGTPPGDWVSMAVPSDAAMEYRRE